ncbi:hypothetical protein BDZ97DRAFT_982760 [Flammula alnicola]|nr:hypothetical protein BDZ97DRAFT_982760 [Flammula alnicola]
MAQPRFPLPSTASSTHLPPSKLSSHSRSSPLPLTPSSSQFVHPRLHRRSLAHNISPSLNVWIWTTLLVFFLSYTPTPTLAFPALELQSPSPSISTLPYLASPLPLILSPVRRDRFVISNSSGTPTVIDPATQSFVPQGPATDAGGKDFNAAAFVWIVFSLGFGVPMLVAGVWGLKALNVGCAEKVRLRLTTGVGVGLAGAVATWAALINSISPSPISDLILTLIVLGFFFFLFIFGCSPYGRLAGIACLGLTGGLAFGIRIVILRPGLLDPGSGGYITNWVLIVISGIAGGMAMVWGKSQRWGLLFACTSTGSFLAVLGVDLIIHKQAGMSRGLRFLFDRNASHFLDIVGGGYTPLVVVQILIGVSLVATPAFAFLQNYFFKTAFRDNLSDEESISGLDSESDLKTADSIPSMDTKIPRTKPTLRQSANVKLSGNVRGSVAYGRASAGVPVGSIFRTGNASSTIRQGNATQVRHSRLWDSFRRR